MTESPNDIANGEEVKKETKDDVELNNELAAAEKPKAPPPAADHESEEIEPEAKTEPAAETVPTVREIFGLPEEGIADSSDDRWKDVQDRLREEVKGIKWTAAMPDLAAKLCQLLEIKLPDVWTAAWKKADELRAVSEKSKLTPEETTYLELAEHSINSEHKPSIDVKLRGAKVKTIELLVQLGFKLKGFVLKVQNGAILEIQTGVCEAKGTLKYAGLNIAEKKLAPIKLPLTIPLEHLAALLQVPESEEPLAESDQEVSQKDEEGDELTRETKIPESDVPENQDERQKPTDDLERIEL